jgi:hypothetical protein
MKLVIYINLFQDIITFHFKQYIHSCITVVLTHLLTRVNIFSKYVNIFTNPLRLCQYANKMINGFYSCCLAIYKILTYKPPIKKHIHVSLLQCRSQCLNYLSSNDKYTHISIILNNQRVH